MTTYVCRTCGDLWSSGPTRDHVDDAQCHQCATEGQDNLRTRVAELQDLLAAARVYVSMCALPENHSCNNPRAAADLLDEIDRVAPINC